MEETKTEKILIPAEMYDDLKKHGNPDELVTEAVENHLQEFKGETNKKEADFVPAQIIATTDVDEVIKQEWIHCLPRPAEYCNIKIVGNSIIITPVEIIEKP